MTHWTELIVTNEQVIQGTLGAMVDDADDHLSRIVLNDDGAIDEWDQFFISADGEDPDYDTPRGPVDWTGFADALASARS